MAEDREALQGEYDRKIAELQEARTRVVQLEKELREIDERMHPPFYKDMGMFK